MAKYLKNSKKERILNIIGVVLLLMGITVLVEHSVFGRWQYSVWFCNHAMIISGLAVLFRNRFWLTAMLNWSLIPLSLWVIDFIGKVFFGVYIFRITEYMFDGTLLAHIISLQHLFTVPLMLYAMYLLGKPARWAWLGTTLHAAILWIISYYIITPDYNINCVHQACISMRWLPGYVHVWPFIGILMFFVTNWFLVWIFSGREARHQAR